MINGDMAPKIERAFELKLAGESIAMISEATGLFLPDEDTKWKRFFSNRFYIGEYSWSGETYTNIYPAIIDRDLFVQVQPSKPSSLKGSMSS